MARIVDFLKRKRSLIGQNHEECFSFYFVVAQGDLISSVTREEFLSGPRSDPVLNS
jgi:hypothetical protein